MSQITTLEKQNKNKPITDSKIKIKIKEFIHPIMLMLSKTKIKYKINKVNKYNSISGKPIIFAINHTNCNDIPIACNAIKEHGYLLIGKQGLEKMDEIFFNLNGVIYVDRKNKDDTTLSKDAMCSYLKKNKNLIVFPEGTWNLTDNLLMLNMKWGIVDIAREADAQIIPVVLDYDDKNMVCSAKFGEPIVVESSDFDRHEFSEKIEKSFQDFMDAHFKEIQNGEFDGYTYLYKRKLSWWKKIEKRLKNIGMKKKV